MKSLEAIKNLVIIDRGQKMKTLCDKFVCACQIAQNTMPGEYTVNGGNTLPYAIFEMMDNIPEGAFEAAVEGNEKLLTSLYVPASFYDAVKEVVIMACTSDEWSNEVDGIFDLGDSLCVCVDFNPELVQRIGSYLKSERFRVKVDTNEIKVLGKIK
jgi:hypothetical protein